MTMVKTTLRSAYLAGPMRGYVKYNFPAFHAAAAILRDMNWEIFSPAERDEQDPDIDHEANVAGWSGTRGLDYFMAYDLKAVCEMDAVICLPGWEESQGARLETVTAVEIGHPVFAIEYDDPHGTINLLSVDPDYIQEVFAARGVPPKVVPVDVEPLDAEGLPDAGRDRDQEAFDAFTYEGDESGYQTARALCAPSPYDQEAVTGGGTLPTDSLARKGVPLATGVLDYFPAALVEVAKVSKAGNDKHNPGQPLHHARGKSTDHADALLRHLIDRGKADDETGQLHSAEMAWRALALLQQELEDSGAPLARGARLPEEDA